MRKIIIPTDFSENAYNALKYAVELFKHEKCEIFLLHAYSDEVYDYKGLLDKKLLDELKQKAEIKSNKQLERTIEDIKQEFSNPQHNFKGLAVFGMLVDEINDLVNQENADIIVMGTRGETNDRLITFGSNTLQVVKYVVCPVLCIPEDYPYKTPENILFPSDYMIPFRKRELKLVAEIVRNFSASMHMLFISKTALNTPRQEENFSVAKEHFYNTNFKFHNLDGKRKSKVIAECIENMEIDLLVMINSRHTILENMLFKSTIDKIGLHPKIPFLVLQNFPRK